MIKNFSYIIIFSGSVISFMLGLGQLVTTRPLKKKIYTSLLFFNITIMLLGAAGYIFELQKIYPHLSFINLAPNFFIGPLLFVNFNIFLENNISITNKKIPHFIPGILIFIILIPYFVKNADTKMALLLSSDNMTQYETILFEYLDLLFTLGNIHMVLYIILFIIKSSKFWNSNSFKREPLSLHLFIFTIFICLVMIISIISGILNKKEIDLFANMCFAFLLIWGFLIGQRYPKMLMSLKEESDKIQYERSSLNGININASIEKLKFLMENEKIYTNENINIKVLSQEMKLTVHQVSELLNHKLGTKFYDYINNYRIQEAKKILIDEPERSVLSVAYAVGFNSQSTFYAVFLRNTGHTPAGYRKQHKS